MRKTYRFRSGLLIVLIVLVVAFFIFGIGFMIWGVRWMGGQKDFRRELGESIGDSVLAGVTAVGPDGQQSQPRLDGLNQMLLLFTDSEYYVSRGSADEGADIIVLSFGDGAELTLTLMGDEGVRAEFTSAGGRDYRYDLDARGMSPVSMMSRLCELLGLADESV
ncbi:MAG TPA: hypothetical protein IAB77_02700 [Candidatus Scatomorpha intestinavium]|uniref:Uncharacterized protein n=1 Tax=Candidatus Scatomorpha intestinavium TaxID=2840922 RepID=A0A9D0ZCQ9_9FIRM|nr:hypothetical protein [Candidatus Scatomorpha intestinavium]